MSSSMKCGISENKKTADRIIGPPLVFQDTSNQALSESRLGRNRPRHRSIPCKRMSDCG